MKLEEKKEVEEKLRAGYRTKVAALVRGGWWISRDTMTFLAAAGIRDAMYKAGANASIKIIKYTHHN